MQYIKSELEKKVKCRAILCLCEGEAEKEVINSLLAEDKLIFSREDLIGEKVHKRKSVKEIEKEFLEFDHGKPVLILRIIDSRREKFNLRKVYRDTIEVISAYTNPEIEILIISNNGDLDDYERHHNRNKKCQPKDYCKDKYGYKCRKGEFLTHFNEDELIKEIKKHKTRNKKQITIADILKE